MCTKAQKHQREEKRRKRKGQKGERENEALSKLLEVQASDQKAQGVERVKRGVRQGEV